MTWPAVSPQHRRQPTSDHRSVIDPSGIHPNDTRRRAISSGGRSRPLATAPISPQFPRNTAKMKGIWGENGCSGRDRPPRANRRIWHSSKWYWWMADEAPVVSGRVLTMLWGSKLRGQVIVPWFWACFQPIISWSIHIGWLLFAYFILLDPAYLAPDTDWLLYCFFGDVCLFLPLSFHPEVMNQPVPCSIVHSLFFMDSLSCQTNKQVPYQSCIRCVFHYYSPCRFSPVLHPAGQSSNAFSCFVLLWPWHAYRLLSFDKHPSLTWFDFNLPSEIRGTDSMLLKIAESISHCQPVISSPSGMWITRTHGFWSIATILLWGSMSI